MIDRYAASKYTEAFPGDMYPASHSGSNVSVANDNQDYKVSREENVTLEHGIMGTGIPAGGLLRYRK